MRQLIAFVIGVSLIFVLMTRVEAQTIPPQQPHAHHPEDLPMHDKFYKTWMRPDNRAMSCCNQIDCYPVEAKKVDGFWYVKQRETGNWVKVPTEKIETDRDNPDSRNHVCMSSSRLDPLVYCFIEGGGT